MAEISASFAALRFGLGLRGEATDPISKDLRDALLEEAATQSELPGDGEGLEASPKILAEFRKFQVRRKEALKAQRLAQLTGTPPTGKLGAEAVMQSETVPAQSMSPEMERPPQNVAYQKELTAKYARLQAAPFGFFERLVDFWANHFAVDARRSGMTRATVGSYEREAIRPNVLGRFEIMLSAVARHPAMLNYLDNWVSVGVNSRAAKRRPGRGLNENFGRELMELHTLGVDGGYDQADVRALANALTGWTIDFGLQRPETVGKFVFQAQRHEPGPVTVMGKTYPQKGEAQAAAIIADLARHPATARHVSRKLVQAFVADEPPPELVAKLADVFLKTDGDLMAVAKALVTAPESWQAPRAKLRSPQEFVIASTRALGLTLKPAEITRSLVTLGQMYWQPLSPAGYPGDSRNWLAPDAMTNRLDVAQYMAARAKPEDPMAIADRVLGDLLTGSTREAIGRAESPAQAYALLLMSPEFQRR
ncbi:DUF1800 domain-containing protein [Jiella sonneratiae]|uniref:DUF1800 domain-containing protein n=1 Tax=Jiella sonneratiae TaxID=2816856 RepID=A0ABS3J8Q9_9HYPH|nr:DUF1800 domain-containing protein [Jiella sonneratiae]MBO0906054.1 DUF1800 domain-containing protein [Jiella sonneratiae]